MDPLAGLYAGSLATKSLAADAASLVDVDYDPLPAVVNMEEAIAPGSPLVHADATRAASPCHDGQEGAESLRSVIGDTPFPAGLPRRQSIDADGHRNIEGLTTEHGRTEIGEA